jgi:hypothetical protein
MHAAEMDSECREALVQEQKKRASSLDFNPSLKSACEKDLEALEAANKCPAATQGAFLAYSGSHGKRYKCLLKNEAALQDPDCKRLVHEKRRWHSADLRSRPGMEKACKDDLSKLCPDVTPGAHRWHGCLQKKVEQIQNEKCKLMVQDVHKEEAKSAAINFAVRKYCPNERKAFCKDVIPGQSRMLTCLRLKEDDPLMGQGCKKALERLEKPKLKEASVWETLSFDAKLKELQNWVGQHKSLTDKYGGLLLGGTIGFVSLLTFGLSYLLFRRIRYGKASYAVVSHE